MLKLNGASLLTAFSVFLLLASCESPKDQLSDQKNEVNIQVKPYEWREGSVFREYTYFGPDAPGHGQLWPVKIEEVDPGSKFSSKEIPTVEDRVVRARSPRILNMVKADANYAELLLELTNCHIGTPGWYTYNHKEKSRSWLPLPREVGTPGPPELYHHTILGSRDEPLNLDWIVEGENIFQFTAGPQMKYSWDFGCFWVYDFTVRMYYPRKAYHPSVEIVNISDGDNIGEGQEIVVEATPGSAAIKKVDVFAFNDGFNESGSGFTREWHGQLRYGIPYLHVGSISVSPYKIKWNTEWIPDQKLPVRLVARVVDEDGWNSVSQIIEDLHFNRNERSVKRFQAMSVPERFSVMNGQEKQCEFFVDSPVENAKKAVIMVNTSFGSEALECVCLNDVEIGSKFGRQNRYGTDTLDVDISILKKGKNMFIIKGSKTNHGPEFDWPGPSLFIEY